MQGIAGGLTNMFHCGDMFLSADENTDIHHKEKRYLFGLWFSQMKFGSSVGLSFLNRACSLLIHDYHNAFVWLRESCSDSRTQSVTKKKNAHCSLQHKWQRPKPLHSDFKTVSRFILTIPLILSPLSWYPVSIYNNSTASVICNCSVCSGYLNPSFSSSVQTSTTQFRLLNKTVMLSLAPGSRRGLISTLCCWAVTMQQFLGFPLSRCKSAYYYIVILKLELCPQDFPQGLQVSLL